jgi:hypothetical protein
MRNPLRPRGRIGRRDAERLLDRREPVHPAHAGVAALLVAAAGPPSPHETRGERAAVDRFRQTYDAAERRRPPRRRHRIVAVLVAATAAVLLGGTAYAAHTGQLPDPLQRAAHDFLSAVGVPAPDKPSPTPTRTAAPSPSPTRAGTGPGLAGPSPSVARLRGLCQVWRSAEQDPHASPITNIDRRVLGEAAGGDGRKEIDDYCARLLGPTPDSPGAPATPDPTLKPGKPSPATKPTHPVKPSH